MTTAQREIDLIKQLLFGAILRTYDVYSMDNMNGGIATIEKGDDLETAFEKQWEIIEPRFTELLSPNKKKGSHE